MDARKRSPNTLLLDAYNDLYIKTGLLEHSENRIPAIVSVDHERKIIELEIPDDIPKEIITDYRAGNKQYVHETGTYTIRIKTGSSAWVPSVF